MTKAPSPPRQCCRGRDGQTEEGGGEPRQQQGLVLSESVGSRASVPALSLIVTMACRGDRPSTITKPRKGKSWFSQGRPTPPEAKGEGPQRGQWGQSEAAAVAFLDSDDQADVNQGQDGDNQEEATMRKGRVAVMGLCPWWGCWRITRMGCLITPSPSLDLLIPIRKPQGPF